MISVDNNSIKISSPVWRIKGEIVIEIKRISKIVKTARNNDHQECVNTILSDKWLPWDC